MNISFEEKLVVNVEINGYIFEIHFKDQQFEKCNFNFSGIYNLDHWKCLARVGSIILEIQRKLDVGKSHDQIKVFYGS